MRCATFVKKCLFVSKTYFGFLMKKFVKFNYFLYIYRTIMPLIESAKFNKGKGKIYLGVPGNLVAFACKISFESGFGGYVAFDAKTALIRHYQETLYATHFKGTKMYINTPAASRLVEQYFSNTKTK